LSFGFSLIFLSIGQFQRSQARMFEKCGRDEISTQSRGRPLLGAALMRRGDAFTLSHHG
jgi:hypothetical protein